MAMIVLFVVLGLIGLCGADSGAEKELVAWAIKNGAKASVRIGLNSVGHRGLLASKSVKPGDILLTVPLTSTIALGASTLTAPVSA
eukprot:gene19289-25933_t